MELIYTGLKPSIPQEEPAGAGERRQKNGIEKKNQSGYKKRQRSKGKQCNHNSVCKHSLYETANIRFTEDSQHYRSAQRDGLMAVWKDGCSCNVKMLLK